MCKHQTTYLGVLYTVVVFARELGPSGDSVAFTFCLRGVPHSQPVIGIRGRGLGKLQLVKVTRQPKAQLLNL